MSLFAGIDHLPLSPHVKSVVLRFRVIKRLDPSFHNQQGSEPTAFQLPEITSPDSSSYQQPTEEHNGASPAFV